ncbi:hypothetical protein [Klebsiella sp. BIGb0407]|uniref:hypothetical protein n=1 Tax=Klebsiella sp. BIGb0407 TaxID=2940603 RepID=UPI002169D653|nr:hypothetical protein [Klebsiella sp. BIGb0407]MCS3430570.1 hypothetical protein [Klebsiella sp. BIGb0407]
MSDDNAKDMARNNQSIQPASDSAAIEDIRRMFVDEIQVPRIVNNNQTPAKRAAFAKTHGTVSGSFQVVDNLPERYQVGIFIPGKRYTAWVRYSSDIAQTAADLNSTVGIGIKLFGITGRKSIDQEADGSTLDFILQNTEVFFASDADDMVNFKSAAMSGKLDAFLVNNPEMAAVLDSMDKKVDTLLGEPLWSCVPFKFGNDYCKFKLHARTLPSSNHVANFGGINYLAEDLAYRLRNSEIKLDFYVQLRNNPAKQSLTDARNLWDEREAVPYKVATLTLYQQDIRTRQQQEYGESLSFNLWRTLPEMEPVGSIAEARKVIYQSSAEVRRNVNGQSIGEPDKPRASQLAGMPVFTPTLDTPWPIGTLGNSSEDFSSFGPHTIQKNHFTTKFPEITISARDTLYPIYVNDRGNLSGNPLMQRGIIYVNYPYGSSTIRLLFEKHNMKNVSFDLIVARGISESLMTISSYQDTKLIESSETGDINARVTIQPANGSYFNVLTFKINNGVFAFSLNNFVMTYA